jgi:exo-beta-1,3-glucanase (GH17 family)
MAPNSTMAVPPTVPETTSCTEEGKTSMYTPVVPASTGEAHKPSSPVPVVPGSSMPGYPAVPESTKPAYPAVPESSKPAYPEVPMSSTPAYPAVPESSKPAVPAVPESSTTCTEEEGMTSSMEAPKPTGPAPVPEHSTPAVPAVPETSTTCTEEEGKPTGPAPVPENSKPAYPSVPEVTKPAYPSVPEVSKPAVPEVPEASKPAYPSVPEQSKPAVPEVPEVSKPAYTPAVPSSSKEAEKPKPTPSTSKGSDKPKPTGSYNNGEHIVTNGDKWAITYTPYANSGDCKTADEISSDIKKIHELGFTTIRSYSTDCGVFEHVVPECTKYGLKVIYGIFLEAGGKGGRGPFSSYANDQLNDIKENAPKDSVAMVIVGNECVFNGNCEVNELGSYLDYVRDELRGAGFPSDIAITTTETVGSWEENGAALCSHIDIFTVQIHPYFTQSVTADMAGEFAAQQLEQAAKVCPEAAAKGKFITEIGWPSAGDSNGLAVAGVQQQKTAMKTIMENVGPESCLFSFQNDGWKEPGNLNVEQNFGCVDSLIDVLGLSINLDISL